MHLTAIPRRPLVLLSPPTGSLTTVDPVRSGVKTGSSPHPRAEPASGPSSRTTGTVSDGPLQVSAAVRQPGEHYPRRPGRANRAVLRRRDRPTERPPKTAVPLTSDRTEPIGRTRAPRRRFGRAPPVLGRNRTAPHVERPRRHPAGPEGNRGSGRPRERRSTNGQRPRVRTSGPVGVPGPTSTTTPSQQPGTSAARQGRHDRRQRSGTREGRSGRRPDPTSTAIPGNTPEGPGRASGALRNGPRRRG